MNKQPLVSFIVIAYNQEKYIEEAIRGAFSQTYEPLEIILSDDSSPDKTFEIMQRLAEEYDGPHKVVLNRNEPNLGIGGHINRVMELSQGEFIVVNAGDDISLPERTTELVNVWLRSGRKAKSICSDCYKMDVDGEVYDTMSFDLFDRLSSPQKILESNSYVLGATHGWDRDIFDVFGPLNSQVIHEDCILPLRSALLGRVEYIQKPLIKYRDGGISSGHYNMSGYEYLYTKRPITYQRYIVDYNQKIQDLTIFKAKEGLFEIAKNKLEYYKCVVELSGCKSVKQKLKVLSRFDINKTIIIELIKYLFSNTYEKYVDMKSR